ncbi:unnamed protein product [Haemonchus placei]|uniref:Uncharacterized protein n=1 Tax=Haemonchus placei TaxID=6290 RepID=A0A0N4WEB3_HAEPC|nr:unnamed protein product [Haemonchus placei]
MVDAQILAEVSEYLRTKMENHTKRKSQNKMEGLFTMQIKVQFPELELPDFEGDMVKFPEFWGLYQLAVHNNAAIAPTAKFAYLKNKLEGTAHDIIASITMSTENYPQAINLLLSTYNKPDDSRNRLVEQLEGLSPAGKPVKEQRVTLCKVKAIWSQLATLKERIGCKTIRSKFPRK